MRSFVRAQIKRYMYMYSLQSCSPGAGLLVVAFFLVVVAVVVSVMFFMCLCCCSPHQVGIGLTCCRFNNTVSRFYMLQALIKAGECIFAEINRNGVGGAAFKNPEDHR